MANTLQRWTFAFAGLFLFSTPSWGLDNYKEFKRDRWDFELGSQFFYTQANYASSGANQNLSGGNHYQLLDVTLATRYVPRQDWSVFAAGAVSSAESKDSVATRTNSAFSDAMLGFDFVMYSGWFQLVPEVLAIVPIERMDTKADSVFISEGVYEVRSRLIAQKNFSTWRGYGWLGFNYRGDGRSFLMPWGIGVQKKGNRFRWGAELFGYQSIADDTDKESTSRTAYINAVNAGSLKFLGVNPSLMDTQAYATWVITPKWSLQANGGMTLMGTNAAAGYHVGGFIRYSFDMTEGYTEETYVPIESPVPNYRANTSDEELSSEKKVRDFREETQDGIDQNLFKARPTPKPRVNENKLQKQLDETEFQIELKGKSKKGKRRR